jgi:acyl carrier protein
VFAPKVAGAFHLHTLTRHLELDFFVLYSSLAALLGPPGLANYAAANAFMDGLARLRRAQGLVASSINWGPFDDIGMASSATHRAASAQHRGLHNLTLAEGRQIFLRAIALDAPNCVAARIDLRQWLESAPQLATWPFVSELKARAVAAAPHAALLDRTLLALLPEQAAEQAVWTLLECVNRHLAEVLRVEVAQLGDPRTPFMELGLESLMALELRNRLESTLGLRLSTTLLYAHPNALALCRELLPRLTGTVALEVGRTGFASPAANGGGIERRSSAAADDHERDSIDDLSDAELLRVVEELSA